MTLKHLTMIVPILFALQPGTAFAAPAHPIFCDEIHVKVCRPPTVIGGVYPHCFCSVETLRPSGSGNGPIVATGKTALSCANKCAVNAIACHSRVEKMCNPLHHPCDDAGLQAQQEAAAACESTYQDCSASCTQLLQ